MKVFVALNVIEGGSMSGHISGIFIYSPSIKNLNKPSSTCRKSKPGQCKLIASKSTFLYAAVSRKIVLSNIKAYTTILKDFMTNGQCLIEINRVLA